jgi:predicted porin
MQKKLMALAVAGALAVPAVAAAQSTVQITGRLTYEYGRADLGANRPDTDAADAPGGANFRFRGTENLGGGLSAWFQCESSANTLGLDQTGFCTRNTAVGLRGGFGNVWFGKWDTPAKRAFVVGEAGGEATGILGTSFIGYGGSGGGSAVKGEINQTAHGETQNRQRFKRRESCLTSYETPNFGGFTVSGAFSCGNNVQSDDQGSAGGGTALTNGNTNKKPRVISLGAIYQAGPLGIGLGWEKHKEFGANTAAADLDDRGWGISAAYTFAKRFKVAAGYLDRKWETAPGAHTSKKTWTIGLDAQLAGPHSVHFFYGKAGDSKGNGGAIGGNGGAAAPGSDTGADQWSLAYQYAFSKRTTLRLGYVRVDNDANANSVRIGGTPALLATAAGGSLGQNVDGYAFLIKHSF